MWRGVGGKKFFHAPPAPSYFKCLLTTTTKIWSNKKLSWTPSFIDRRARLSRNTSLISRQSVAVVIRGIEKQNSEKAMWLDLLSFSSIARVKPKRNFQFTSRGDPSRRSALIIYNSYQSSNSDLNIYKLWWSVHTRRESCGQLISFSLQRHDVPDESAGRVSRDEQAGVERSKRKGCCLTFFAFPVWPDVVTFSNLHCPDPAMQNLSCQHSPRQNLLSLLLSLAQGMQEGSPNPRRPFIDSSPTRCPSTSSWTTGCVHSCFTSYSSRDQKNRKLKLFSIK